MMSQAIILFSHGSRDPQWRSPMETVARRIASEHPERPVVCAYLELCTPSLAEAAAHLVDKGAAHITIVPMFLGTGKHAREDLPRLVESLRHSHPTISVEVQQAIGEDERMTALMAKIACEIPVRV